MSTTRPTLLFSLSFSSIFAPSSRSPHPVSPQLQRILSAAMVKRLQVSVGPDRFNLAVASINRPSHPTIINTPLFVGRVLVQVKDFTGVLPTGEEGDEGDETYFEGRSRKFSILIEGRFKGEKPYSGDEVHFGTDFGTFVRVGWSRGGKAC